MHTDPNAPGFNSLTDLRERLWAVEGEMEVVEQAIDQLGEPDVTDLVAIYTLAKG